MKINFSLSTVAGMAINFFIGALAPTPTLAQGVIVSTIPFQSGMIQNMTNLHCRLIARGEFFTTIEPGETIYSGAKKGKFRGVSFHGGFGWYAQSANVDVPIVGLCFAANDYKEYVGVAETVFHVPGNGLSSSHAWIIHAGDIHPMEGQVAPRSAPIPAAPKLKTVKLPFPAVGANGWETIQFVNNSKYRLIARMIDGGVNERLITPVGGIYYVQLPGYRATIIDIKAIDEVTGEIVGVWQQTFRGQTYGISGENRILQKSSFHN